MRKIDAIILHCTDSTDDGSIGAEEIDQWHKERAKTEPWSHYIDHNGVVRYIGYHYVVKRDGNVDQARPESEVGCHCKGMNKSSLGVVWVGRTHMAARQKPAVVQIVAELCVEHALSAADVYGHCQFSKKTCPNFDSAFTFESMDDFRRIIEMVIREIK